MNNLKRLAALALALCMSTAMLTACGGSSTGSVSDDSTEASEETEATQDDAATQETDSEALVMATNATFPPYEYVEGSEYEGIDVEIAGKIAEKLGRTLDIKDVEFDSIIGGVQSGKYDMGMAGMTVTDERKQSVNFSESYATGIQSVIVAQDSEIASVDDLSSDTRIGVQQGTTGDIYASDDYGADAVTAFKNGADATQALLTGKVDCVIIDNEPAKAFVAANEGLKILDTSYTEEEYAICVSKENEELLDEINGALEELKADGSIDEIIEKYIPSDAQ